MNEKNNHAVNINNKKIIMNIIFISSHSLNLIFKRVICELHHIRCLEIQHFLQKVLTITLQEELKIIFIFKHDAIEHMKINV